MVVATLQGGAVTAVAQRESGGRRRNQNMYKWAVQFICYSGSGSFVALFKTEITALKVFNDALKVLVLLKGKELSAPFSFKDDSGALWSINVMNYTLSMGNVETMAEAVHENNKYQEKIARRLGVEKQVGIVGTGAKYEGLN